MNNLPKKFSVFAIIFGDKKTAFIGKTTEVPSDAYRRHRAGQSPYTRALFAAEEVSCMYVLETLELPEEIAHRRCIAWYARLEQLGFACIGSPSLRDGSTDMLPETRSIFEQIAELSLEDVLTEKNLVPAPSSPKKSKAPTRITFSVSPDTYKKIALAAQVKGLPIATYCRQVAADGCAVNVNFQEVRRYVDAVRSLQAQTQALSLALYRYGACDPDTLAELCATLRAHDAQQQEILAAIAATIATLRQDYASACA